MSRVKQSSEFIAENAQHVHVNAQECIKVANSIHKRMLGRNYSAETWSTHPLNPDKSTPHVTDWIFTVDTLNFSFWDDLPNSRYEVEYNGARWTGYWSMVAAINRALQEGIPITSPSFWVSKEFTPELVAHVFRSSSGTQVPLLNSRYEVLKQAGEALQLNGFTSFEQVVPIINKSALALVDWLATNIPSYNDSFTYKTKTVYIYKRAQILVADLWACFVGKGIGCFTDISEITMFADYRVPQILEVLNTIEYSPTLMHKIQSKQLLPSGSDEEIEIRGCSILAVELIVAEIKKIDPSLETNAVLVDFYLWDTAKEQENENTRKVECHRTRSVFY